MSDVRQTMCGEQGPQKSEDRTPNVLPDRRSSFRVPRSSLAVARRTSHVLTILLAALGLWLAGATPASALEFTADQIIRTDGHNRKSNLYYRDQMWRFEHHDLGPVNVTIVRKDKQVTWLLLSRMKHFKTIPYDPEQQPKVMEHLDGEIRREEIGTETLDGHPTTLYQVTVQQGGRTHEYYQWLATDIHFPLKLARKDGSWQVEYRNVKLHSVSDFMFQLPVNFQPLEEFDKGEHAKPKDQPM